MLRTTSRFQTAAAAIAAASVIAACGSSSSSSSNSSGSSSSSGGSPIQAQIQQETQDAVRFAGCMRSHGVSNFPDPSTDPHAFKDALDPTTAHSPAFQPAVSACQHLMPRRGQQSQNPPSSQAQITAELAFARCLRGHGFPSFPDPSTTGQLTHEMLANAGINIHQPAVVQAADACVGVTHGFLNRADVARFVAGH
ncbi:MAG TPA: hypothetical protein VHZ27_19320 [Solirubrobacteraceae bacterium]|jgi:hypothetical protein|nr:hypothetical protein [Solirubrobacteraceae bacterium]